LYQATSVAEAEGQQGLPGAGGAGGGRSAAESGQAPNTPAMTSRCCRAPQGFYNNKRPGPQDTVDIHTREAGVVVEGGRGLDPEGLPVPAEDSEPLNISTSTEKGQPIHKQTREGERREKLDNTQRCTETFIWAIRVIM